MTALPVILVQPTCPGDQRPKGVPFQSTCNLCRESHKTQVWLCFLVLSFLSACTCAAPGSGTLHLQNCLKSERLKNAIERSDAMLYTPSTYGVEQQHRVVGPAQRSPRESTADCKTMLLKCYMLELMMVINEEEIMDAKADCIFDFNDTLPASYSVGCPPCEAFALKNITVFLESLNNLLQEMNSDTM